MPARDANPVCVEVTRGTVVESHHRAAIAIVDTQGHVVLARGDVEAAILPRSAIKALQALPMVESGAADAYGVRDAELALACASHSGEPVHVEAVRVWLDRLGLDAGALGCGPQMPGDERAAHDLIRRGGGADTLHNTCSGKHTGFLTLARHLGADVAGYTAVEHPVQQRILGVLEQMTGLDDLTAQPRGTDGCGIPTIAMPLGNVALAMARLGDPDDQPDRRRAACRRIRRAIAENPEMVAGRGRFDTRIMARTGERVLIKGGAEGVQAGTCPDLGLGFALKVDDGAGRAAHVLAANLLDRLHRFTAADRDALGDLLAPAVTARTGERAGVVRCVAGFDAT